MSTIIVNHDGYDFEIDTDAVICDCKKYGTYVDGNDVIQVIKRKSIYGQAVRAILLKAYVKQQEG